MSSRNYRSGAQTRKDKAKKDEKDRQMLEKIPKLSNIFKSTNAETENASPSSSSYIVENTNNTEEIEYLENLIDIDVAGHDESSNRQISIVSTSSDIESNDPGLWDIQSNQKSLQSYWFKHGNITTYIFNNIESKN